MKAKDKLESNIYSTVSGLGVLRKQQTRKLGEKRKDIHVLRRLFSSAFQRLWRPLHERYPATSSPANMKRFHATMRCAASMRTSLCYVTGLDAQRPIRNAFMSPLPYLAAYQCQVQLNAENPLAHP